MLKKKKKYTFLDSSIYYCNWKDNFLDRFGVKSVNKIKFIFI